MAIEYRGCRKLVYAKVLTDTAEGMTFGEVKVLAPVQQVQREVSRSSATTYYDNTAANTITAEGAEVNNFVIAVPADDVLADIEGKYYDPENKIYSDSPISDAYYAVGYVLGEKGPGHTQVWAACQCSHLQASIAHPLIPWGHSET